MNLFFNKYYRKILRLVFFLSLAFFIFTCSIPIFAGDLNNKYADFPDIEILFISNLNGNILNCDCGDPSLGGLPQISTLLKEKRKTNPEIIFVDGGDFLNTYPFPELNTTVLEIYKKIKPDIMCLGDQEFIESGIFKQTLLNSLQGSIISTNLRIQYDKIMLKPFSIATTKKNENVCFISYLSEKSFPVYQNYESIIFDSIKFSQAYQAQKSKSLLILIFHGSNEELKRLIDQYPEIDVVLHAHDQSYLVDLDLSPSIIGGGVDGENIIDIRIYGNAQDYEITTDLIPVRKDIKSDPEITMLINENYN